MISNISEGVNFKTFYVYIRKIGIVLRDEIGINELLNRHLLSPDLVFHRNREILFYPITFTNYVKSLP